MVNILMFFVRSIMMVNILLKAVVSSGSIFYRSFFATVGCRSFTLCPFV